MASIATGNADEIVCVTTEDSQHIRLEIAHGIQSTDAILTLDQAASLVYALEALLAVNEDEDLNEGLEEEFTTGIMSEIDHRRLSR